MDGGAKLPPLHIAGETIPLPSLAATLGKLSDFAGWPGTDKLDGLSQRRFGGLLERALAEIDAAFGVNETGS